MRKRVLLVAQEVGLRARIARALLSSDYALELASDEKRALGLAVEGNFQAAIVAPASSLANVPTMLELRDTVPQMIVLAEGPDEIARLRRSLPGVHAFLLKSSHERELIVRLGELTAPPAGGPAPLPSVLSMGDCKLDLAGHVFVNAAGREMPLTRTESGLLQELARSPCRALSRDQLRHAVAGRGADPFDRSIDMIVARLRRKIEPDPNVPRFVVTVPGVGYKLMARAQSAETRQSAAEPTEPERRQLTALSCKLVGALGLAVSFDPEDLIEVIRSFQDAGVAAITRMGGSIAILTPDEILAFFGYPEAHEDDAERAVNAGLDTVAKINQLLSPTGEPLQVRVGVATGLALASHKQIVGEAPSIATGVCNVAAANSLLVTETTRGLLSGAFVCGNPERYVVAGISEAVSACRVMGKRTVESRFKARRSDKITRLFGRDKELQQLLLLWDRAKRGEGQVGLVCGEAGIGKSHLCEAFLGHIAEEPHATIRYQCSPHHIHSPFYPVISELEHTAGFERMDTPEVKLGKLEAALSQAIEATREDVSLYAALLSIATPEHEAPPAATPQRQRDRLIAALSRRLLCLADKRLLTIVLADAHWADSSTLELFNRIVSLIRTARVLVLIKFRPEFTPQWLGKRHVTMLRLDRIGREQSLAIVSEVSGDKKLPREVQEQIIVRADGIPLFIEELTKAVMESDQGNRGQNVAAGSRSSIAVPATLLDSLTARLDRLGRAKEIAQIGAVIGREFSHPLVAAMAPKYNNSVQAALEQLAASELILVSGELPDATYTFKHALVRDAAYSTLSLSKRQQLHSRIADALVNSFPRIVETQPELLAHHLEQAGFTERAVDYLRRAARRSIERSANAEAIGHLTRALELLQSRPDSRERKRARFPLDAMLGQAMIANYGYAAPKTRETLLQARALIDDSTDASNKFAVLYGIWASHYVAGEVAKQQAAAAEFLAEAERAHDSALSCIGNRIVGTTYVTMGEFATGLHHLKRARALYNFEQHASYRHRYGQDIGTSALCYLSWALWHLGHIDQALDAATEAMKLAERLSHPHTLVYTICHARGFMDLFLRRCEDTHSYAGSVVSICNENGFLHWANCGRIFHGWAATCAGQMDRGIALLRHGVAGWQKGGARLWLPMFMILQAEAYSKAGRDEAALEAIEQALAICEDTGERWAMAEVLRSKARLLLSTNWANFGEIKTILLDSLEIAQRQRARCWELRTSCDLALLWERQGRNRKALRLLQSVYDQFTEGFDAPDLKNARVILRRLGRNVSQKQPKHDENA
jgi:DNA-binding response OmpR family regulator/class 3 adenylate cyclase/predicted ATPase